MIKNKNGNDKSRTSRGKWAIAALAWITCGLPAWAAQPPLSKPQAAVSAKPAKKNKAAAKPAAKAPAAVEKAPAPQQPPPGLVAEIGAKAVITEQDISDYSQSESCYGSDAINSRKAGFMRMMEAAIVEEVLEREAKIYLSSGDYQKELDRVDRETQAPEILNCVKKHFLFEKGAGFQGDGRKRYERVFLRKYVMNRPFSNFLTMGDQVQGEVFKKRDQILEKAKQGAAFADLAKEFQVEYATRAYALEEPKESSGAARSPEMRWSPFEKQFIEDHLKGLSPGQMKPQPIDQGDIMFVKLLRQDKDKYDFECLTLKRKDIGQYFSSLPKLRARVYDQELKDWLKGISGNSMLWILQIE